ncbi:MAG: hypothetical protein ACEQSD_08020, partial [Flavobacteriales bacterium]
MAQNPITEEQQPVVKKQSTQPDYSTLVEVGKTPQPDYSTLVEVDNGFGDHLKDAGLSLMSGFAAVPDMAVGIGGLISNGRVGKALEDNTFYKSGDASKYWSAKKSVVSKSQGQQFSDAEGIIDKTATALKNPSMITNTVVESLPSMAVGGAIGRGLGAVSKGAINPIVGGAVGEGAVMAGAQAEHIRQQTDDGLLTDGQVAAGVATGVLGGLFGYAGGRIASKYGFGDIDTLLASGRVSQRQASGEIAEEIASTPMKSIPLKMIVGAISEGFLEELPQSVSEQIIQNIALNKEWSEGVEDAAVMGTLAGMAMGAGGSVLGSKAKPLSENGQDGSSDPNGNPNPTGDGGQGGNPNINPAPNPNVNPPVVDTDAPPTVIPATQEDLLQAQSGVSESEAHLLATQEAVAAAETPEAAQAAMDAQAEAESILAEWNEELVRVQQELSGQSNVVAPPQVEVDQSLQASDIEQGIQVDDAGQVIQGNPPQPQLSPWAGIRSQIQPIINYAKKNNFPIESVFAEKEAIAESLAKIDGLIADAANEGRDVPDDIIAMRTALSPQPEPTPSEQMGLNPDNGSLSAAAALAVDTGVAQIEQQVATDQAGQDAGTLESAENNGQLGQRLLGSSSTGTASPSIDDQEPLGQQQDAVVTNAQDGKVSLTENGQGITIAPDGSSVQNAPLVSDSMQPDQVTSQVAVLEQQLGETKSVVKKAAIRKQISQLTNSDTEQASITQVQDSV